ncbi:MULTISPECIES: A/G-specific adenine glycosylase [unclassified Janthinobacterium]|uniref:A/G-specific adenine glycosylase n=1 Tax=unclassified Janthinobacterium TaxID=2610881 RepID=UPI00160A498F|nr:MULTISPECIES: A/G-specific adenine glycosylase [unclassified Janthinobacterium]MBB5370805.1 A/G-specific adenine glycosylase [Janthinobacterium sp. K2C7]MBB5383611.1 A/G-specific adenine glycosylase [Janthinobacterium sp. K2Li3]MBB5389065.1 A/G-specific adenine glycosylase [Janthinobacterium sp. K2E3]
MKRLLHPLSPAPGMASSENYSDPSFSATVIAWQKQHGRHALPWQNTRDAYLIWLSEIMLQQTQVTAVLGYYARFLERFPTLRDLAAAPVEDVMAQWSGLGYYTRARNLHKCAQRVVAEYDGVFPSDPLLLAELPGIGRSTAAAISAFSSGTRAAIMDGNVKRVFARTFGIDAYPGEKKVEEAMWRRAEALLPETGIEAYTQGLMDFGATLCTRSSPDCGRCPLQPRCVAYATNRVKDLPVRKPKKTSPEKHAVMLVVIDNGQVLLEQRPATGIWGGLLSLPELDGHVLRDGSALPSVDDEQLARAILPFGEIESRTTLLPIVHVFTHYKLHIIPCRITLARRLSLAGEATHVWYDGSKIADAPLPAPIKKLLLELFGDAQAAQRSMF